MFKSFRGLRPSQVLLVVGIGALPLVQSQSLFHFYLAPQKALLVTLLGLCLSLGAAGSLGWFKEDLPQVRLAVYALLGLLAWLSLATLTGLDPVRSLLGQDSYGTGLVFWAGSIALFIAVARARAVLARPFLTVLVAGAVLMLVLFVMWSLSGETLDGNFLPESREGVPLVGLGNSALLATFLAVGIVSVFGQIMRSKRWYLWSIAASGLAVFLLVCQSRVATGMAAAGIGVGSWLALRRGEMGYRLSVSVMLLVLGGLAGQLWAYPVVSERKAATVSARSGSAEEGPSGSGPSSRFELGQISGGVSVRKVIWSAALGVVGDHLLTGIGPNNLAYEFPSYANREEAIRTLVSRQKVNDAHDVFLELGVSAGVPAALAFSAFCVLVVVGMRKRPVDVRASRRKRDDLKDENDDPRIWLKIALGILFGLHLFQPVSVALTPLMFALAAVSMTPVDRAPESGERAWWRLIPATALVLTGLVAGSATLYADRLLARGSLEWSSRDLEIAARFSPACQICRYELGKVRRWDFEKEGIGTFDGSMEPNLTASKLHPRDASALIEIGGGYLFLDRPLLAIAPLKRAHELDAFDALALRAWGGAHLRAGQPKEALPPLLKLVELVPSAENFLLLADAAGSAGEAKIAADAREKAGVTP